MRTDHPLSRAGSALLGDVVILVRDTVTVFVRLFPQIITVFLLGWLGSQPPEGGYVLASQICTAYYFAHFLIVMPLCGLFETPKKLPGSILESVTGPGKQVSGSGLPAGAAAAPTTKG